MWLEFLDTSVNRHTWHCLEIMHSTGLYKITELDWWTGSAFVFPKKILMYLDYFLPHNRFVSVTQLIVLGDVSI